MRTLPQPPRYTGAKEVWGSDVGVWGTPLAEYPRHDAKRAPPTGLTGSRASAELP